MSATVVDQSVALGGSMASSFAGSVSTPFGLVVYTAAIVVFTAAVLAVVTVKRAAPAIATPSSSPSTSAPSTPKKASAPSAAPSTPELRVSSRKRSDSPASPSEIITDKQSPKTFRAPPHHTGAIHLIMGPMFSGKTRELKRRIDVKRIASARKELKCLLIKYRKDTRYDQTALVTHNLIKDNDCVAAEALAEVNDRVRDCQFVFVDEGQFFPDLVDHCLRWAREGREVVVAALDAYASQDLWPGIAKLIPWCVSLQKLNAVCGECGSEASLSILRGGHAKNETKIGGKDIYDASCIFCCDKLTGADAGTAREDFKCAE